ncbi:MAG: hypothetical protein HYZ31_03780 [Gammaproteobacteria bacterium]|nr:hypothetical protein [Gammaproteobacteria bacterium]HEX5636641.1 hypothetical protein [Gammaproteobacteria bacterium]
MNNAQSCKCMMSFLWTNALVVGALVFLLFSFIDPAEIARNLMLDVNEGTFRIKVYALSFFFLWLMFNASTFLNCYFSRLKSGTRQQDQ